MFRGEPRAARHPVGQAERRAAAPGRFHRPHGRCWPLWHPRQPLCSPPAQQGSLLPRAADLRLLTPAAAGRCAAAAQRWISVAFPLQSELCSLLPSPFWSFPLVSRQKWPHICPLPHCTFFPMLYLPNKLGPEALGRSVSGFSSWSPLALEEALGKAELFCCVPELTPRGPFLLSFPEGKVRMVRSRTCAFPFSTAVNLAGDWDWT